VEEILAHRTSYFKKIKGMSTLSTGKIDLKRRIVGKGKRHCGSMKTRSKNLRSRKLGALRHMFVGCC
jgi:hypothetical protein